MKEAQKNYKLAGRLLANYKYKPNATAAEVKDISERHLYVADRSSNWEKAFDLMEYALKTWPKDDIHKSLNVNWAAASGLSSDSSEGNRQAIKLLRDNAELSRGYLHPQTVTEMLLMTRNCRASSARSGCVFLFITMLSATNNRFLHHF
ncbi:MAG: hypothetical protein ACJ71U_15435 [Terriglobales bacterium]